MLHLHTSDLSLRLAQQTRQEYRATVSQTWAPNYAAHSFDGNGYTPVIVDYGSTTSHNYIVWEANTSYASPSDALTFASIILAEYRAGSIDLTTIRTTK